MPKGTKQPFPLGAGHPQVPEGRLVQGDIFTMSDKDKMGNIRTVKNGPNVGQPSPQSVIVVAYAKTDPLWLALKAQIHQKAAEDFPQFFPHGATGPCTHPSFSYKYQDGDGFDGDGKPNNLKEGWAGHDVVRYSSGFAPKVYMKDHYAPQEQVFYDGKGPSPCPRGFFIRVSGTIEGNGDIARPALYVNSSLVEISRPGPEIRTGPSAVDAFGGGGPAGAASPPPPAPPAGPAGLVAAPGIDLAAYRASGWTDDQLVAAGHATRPAPAPATPPPPPAPPAAPATPPPPPYTGYMAPPPPAPAAPVRQMTAAAQGLTYEQYIASGWDDAMLIQHGMMVPN